PHASPPTALLLLRDPPPTEISTLSLHDALPIYPDHQHCGRPPARSPGPPTSMSDVILQVRGLRTAFHTEAGAWPAVDGVDLTVRDRKSTRLNSSHVKISYAVFCLKKKKRKN